MTCAYCGHEAPVPDVEERRRARERERVREEKRQREVEAREERKRQERRRTRKQRRREAEKKKQARRHRWARRLASIPGCLMTLAILAICLAGPAYGLWQSGVLHAFAAGSGAEAHDGAVGAATAAGYALGSPSTEVWAMSGGEHEQVLELRGDLCYSVSVASGTPISRVRLLTPDGSDAAESQELAFAHQLFHCPEKTGVHKLLVTLDKGYGRYTWSWSWKAQASGSSSSKATSSGSGSRSGSKASSTSGRPQNSTGSSGKDSSRRSRSRP